MWQRIAYYTVVYIIGQQTNVYTDRWSDVFDYTQPINIHAVRIIQLV